MEQIIKIPKGYKLRKEGNTYTVEKEEQGFIKGRDYIHSSGAIIIDITSNNPYIEKGFGSTGEFTDITVYKNTRNEWKEVEEEKVNIAFKAECDRVFGYLWEEAKLKSHASGKRIALNTGNHVPIIEKGDYNGWIVWNKNGCLYHKGKWADKLEEPKFAENLEDIDRPWYLDTFGEAERLFEKEGQDKNHLPTEELTEGLLALTQLLSFRHDVWEKEGKPEGLCWCIKTTINEGLKVTLTAFGEFTFSFKKKEIAEWFLKTHKNLLTEYFNKIIE